MKRNILATDGRRKGLRYAFAILIGVCGSLAIVSAQQGTLTAQQKQQRIDAETELQSIAVVTIGNVRCPCPTRSWSA